MFSPLSFEEVEREHHEPPADQLWSQAAGQPQSPSEAPVTGLSSHWKSQKTCIEYCNPTHDQSPPGRTKKDHSNPRSRIKRIKKSGKLQTCLGGLQWGETSGPHGRRGAAFGVVVGKFSFMTAKCLPFSPSNYSAVSHQDGC